MTLTSLLPILVATASAAILGFNMHIQKKALLRADPATGATISVFAMAAFFWLLSPLYIDFRWFLHPSILFFVLAGLMFPALGQYCQIKSVSIVGPSLTSSVSSFMPVFAAIPAVIFLGEVLTPRMLLGFAIVIGAVLFIAAGGVRGRKDWPLWALLVPIGAAAARGFAQPLTKAGLADIPNPLFATMVMGTVSSVVLLAMAMAQGRSRKLVQSREATGWFSLVGVINGIGILLIVVSVALGDVTQVMPFVGTVPLWTLLWGVFVFRTEVMTPVLLATVIAVVIGAGLIVS